MASSSSSAQHRCVFVGNIPYDATEEQLIEICREVGPVVSFRLVIDRETGKPKGYGFCEYKDEETALSARRNLQGYEINGRQLRVDFAENDKNTDRTREQGRGGPALGVNIEQQKHMGGSVSHSESSHHQPIGLQVASNAASVLSVALGGVQSGLQSNANASQPPTSDPITFHLAKMSKIQLNAIVSDLKGMAIQNKEAAKQLLLMKPQLSKAIFQAQMMLGMVTPQMLQNPNIRQSAGHPSNLSLHAVPQANNKSNLGLTPKFQSEISSTIAQNPFSRDRVSASQHTSAPNSSRLTPNSNPLISRHTVATAFIPSSASTHLSSNSAAPNIARDDLLPVGTNSAKPDGNIAFSDSTRWAQKRPPTVSNNLKDSLNYPFKIRKLHEDKTALNGEFNAVPSSGFGLVSSSQPCSDKHPSQISADTQSALLQQVMKLTPEQLSLLPAEQRQQVIQLQLALREEHALPL